MPTSRRAAAADREPAMPHLLLDGRAAPAHGFLAPAREGAPSTIRFAQSGAGAG
jgi:hypothetical protein